MKIDEVDILQIKRLPCNIFHCFYNQKPVPMQNLLNFNTKIA